MHEITTIDENGVILEKKSVPEGGKLIQKVSTPKQEQYNNTHVNKFNQGVRWGKIYVDMMPYVEKELSSTDWMFFCRLMSCINFETCVLYQNANRHYNPLSNIDQIAKYLDKPYHTCYLHMKNLIKQEVIIVSYTGNADNKITVYTCNPYIFFNGKNLEKSAWAAFRTTKWAKYNEEICKSYKICQTNELLAEE